RGNTEQAKALKSSLRDLLKNDEELCKEYELLNTWLSVPEEENVRVLQYIVSHETNSTQPLNFNNTAKEEPAVSTINNNSDDLNDYEKINEPLALKVFALKVHLLKHVERSLFSFDSFQNIINMFLQNR
ncbi:15775_t:CDS:2, partial [Funneliformis caledonium]